jgi:hypothetical protein
MTTFISKGRYSKKKDVVEEPVVEETAVEEDEGPMTIVRWGPTYLLPKAPVAEVTPVVDEVVEEAPADVVEEAPADEVPAEEASEEEATDEAPVEEEAAV